MIDYHGGALLRLSFQVAGDVGDVVGDFAEDAGDWPRAQGLLRRRLVATRAGGCDSERFLLVFGFPFGMILPCFGFSCYRD